MVDDDLLRKIDRTLERNNDAFDRHGKAFDRMMAAFDRFDKRFDRFEERFDRFEERLDRDEKRAEERDREFKRYLDALTERHAGITQRMIESMEAFFAQLQAEIADQRAQIQANTQALLRVLDRLEPQG